MNQNTKDIIAGYFSGWLQVFVVQPFQMVKTRIQYQAQNSHVYNGVFDCFKKIYKNQGFLTFYKGTLAPLIGTGLQTSAMFWSYQSAKRYFSRYKQSGAERLSIEYIMLSGTCTAIPIGIIACPVQHSRIRMQIQQRQAKNLYTGSLDAIGKILRQHGVTGLYRGLLPTISRSGIGNAFYFGSYEMVIRSFLNQTQKSSSAPLIAQVLGGSLAGVVFFSCIYPVDYVKTIMQSDSLDKSKRQFNKILFTFKYILREKGGIGGLYRGATAAYMMAILRNAIGFPVFETSLDLLGRNQNEN